MRVLTPDVKALLVTIPWVASPAMIFTQRWPFLALAPEHPGAIVLSSTLQPVLRAVAAADKLHPVLERWIAGIS